MLDFSVLLWYCVVLTGGATNGKHNQRTVARQYHTARGQQNQLKGDERAPWVYGTSSRRPRKDLYLGTERNLREVPRLLERVCKSWRVCDILLRFQAWHENRNRGVNRRQMITIYIKGGKHDILCLVAFYIDD